ncbi:MAG TPA: circadian clock protein KaiB [Gemmatimonadaceae bacterium]|nr:circadian clock protein KaiB [Gemmatimonadaceae bacterium]
MAGLKDAFPARMTEVPLVNSEANRQGGALPRYVLRLYVTGTSPRAQVAIENLRRICEQDLRGQYDLEIIDVLAHPEVAESEKILATPTLIKQLPPPLRRVIGDLSDKEKVLLGLEVRPDSTTNDRSQ